MSAHLVGDDHGRIGDGRAVEEFDQDFRFRIADHGLVEGGHVLGVGRVIAHLVDDFVNRHVHDDGPLFPFVVGTVAGEATQLDVQLLRAGHLVSRERAGLLLLQIALDVLGGLVQVALVNIFEEFLDESLVGVHGLIGQVGEGGGLACAQVALDVLSNFAQVALLNILKKFVDESFVGIVLGRLKRGLQGCRGALRIAGLGRVHGFVQGLIVAH